MPREPRSKGRLLAVEGFRGPLLAVAAEQLLHSLCPGEEHGGVSPFDGSNIFYELKLGKAKKQAPSPRTLLLLYAADLCFRVRWHIRPALEEGMVVVAAPYLESALAFGLATGLERKWMVELFRFAPKPQAVYRLAENKKPPQEKQKAGEGFLEFCISMLKHGTPPWDPQVLRVEFLSRLERVRRCQVWPPA